MNLELGAVIVRSMTIYYLLHVLIPFSPIQAQITPDQTLPSNSVVKQEGNTSIVEEGTTRGSNLFHSFESFSVPKNGIAYFNNSLTIKNIISRVTGDSISSIDGLLKANGTANLFLINHNGIIFGPNARLEIGGSFFGTTASAIKFADGSVLRTSEKAIPQLLTIATPTGLELGSESGSIRVEGSGHDLTPGSALPSFIRQSYSSGLQVLPGKTLGLIAGDLFLNGGLLTAPGGIVELGAVKSGYVAINHDLTVDYKGAESFGDIRLTQKSLVDVSGVSSGSVQIQAAEVSLNEGSMIWSQNFGSSPGGDIKISSSRLLLEGTTKNNTAIISDALGNGSGSNIDISTGQLRISGPAAILSSTFGSAKGGNISIQSSNLELLGTALNPRQFNSGIGTFTYGSGPGGDLNISTETLVVKKGILNTITAGPGRGGNSTVSAKKISVSEGGVVGTFTFGSGRGGDQLINASTVEVSGEASSIFSPSVINAATFGSGNAGNLTLNIDRLSVRNGGRVDTASLASGNAGNLLINASESVEVSGVGPITGTPSSIDSSVSILAEPLQEFFLLPPVPTGNSGNVTIRTKNLIVQDGGMVSVRNDGPGLGGTLQIRAKVITLDNQASINASTAGGNGGSIDLKVEDLLLLRNNSSITASAQAFGDGGNVDIDSDLVVLLNASSISANAEQGTGGRVAISTQGLFVSPDSAITATSKRGPEFSGVVELNVPNVDFSRAAAQPVNVPESPDIIAACDGTRAARAATFINARNAGIPPSPTDSLTGDMLWHRSAPTDGSPPASSDMGITELDTMPEAQGWIRNPNGTYSLTADVSRVIPQSSAVSARCR